jgi:subtilisin family serine protease
MMMAADDGADVISMSLGSLSPNEEDDPYSIVTAGLNKKGVAVIVATGNDGDLGTYSPSSPGVGSSVLAVGSVDNKNYPVTYQLSDSHGRHFRYSSIFPIDADPAGMSFIILAGPDASEAQACLTISYRKAAAQLVDANTTILAIRSGAGCTSTLKAQNAGSYGFKYVMFYSTADTEITSFLGYYALEPLEPGVFNPATFAVNPDNSGSIINEIAKNSDYKVFFSTADYVAQSPAQLTGGFMSNFSSFGPTTELDMKPEISAPGGNILSTWPLSAGGYAVLSGTSMATPFMAGCYALIKSQLSNLNVNDTFSLLMNTATPMSWYYDQSFLSSAVQQGTGLVNPQTALDNESLVTPQQLNAGGSEQPVKKTVTIKNRSTRSKTYVLSHRPAGVAQLEVRFPSRIHPSQIF